jgi:phospholipid-binding lipoprotein MlaA
MKKIPRIISAELFFILLVPACLFLGGCAKHAAAVHEPEVGATQQEALIPQADDEFALEAEFDDPAAESVLDPLSGYNRVMTQVNDKVYFWVLKPVAQGYRFVMPETARLAVGRFFNNLLMPVRFANNLLQFKVKRAGTELTRFVVNSTVGVLGFGDYYGVGSGFHIVLPLLGPSNLRDTIGLIPDYYLDPVSHIDHSETALAVRVYRQVNHTSLHIGEYESLKKDAVDHYTFLRDGYEQRRKQQIKE